MMMGEVLPRGSHLRGTKAMAESDHQVASIVDGALFLGYNYLNLEIVGQKLELRELCQTLLKLDFVQFSLRNRQPAQAGSTQHVTLNRHRGEKPMSEKSSHPTDVDARWQGHH